MGFEGVRRVVQYQVSRQPPESAHRLLWAFPNVGYRGPRAADCKFPTDNNKGKTTTAVPLDTMAHRQPNFNTSHLNTAFLWLPLARPECQNNSYILAHNCTLTFTMTTENITK
jgi:hypothetical protein